MLKRIYQNIMRKCIYLIYFHNSKLKTFNYFKKHSKITNLFKFMNKKRSQKF